MALPWMLNFLMARWTPLPLLHWMALCFLGFGIYLALERPIVRNGGSPALETGLIAICGLIFILHLAWVFLIPRMEEEEAMSKPCSPKTLEMQCYMFSQENCSSVWDHYSKECYEEVKRTILSRRSTALTGPIVRRCIYKRLDQSFRTNRRTPLNELCENHFNSLDAMSLEQ